jgi:hypothetical protein
MGLAGYPVPDHSLIDLKQVGLAARLGDLTREEENELVEYLAFLRSRRRR